MATERFAPSFPVVLIAQMTRHPDTGVSRFENMFFQSLEHEGKEVSCLTLFSDSAAAQAAINEYCDSPVPLKMQAMQVDDAESLLSLLGSLSKRDEPTHVSLDYIEFSDQLESSVWTIQQAIQGLLESDNPLEPTSKRF